MECLEVELLEEVSNSSLGSLLLVLVLVEVTTTSDALNAQAYDSWNILAIFFKYSFFSATGALALGRASKANSTLYLKP